MENNKLNWKKLIDDLDIKYDERFLLGENLETLLRRDIFTLGARGFSCAVSGFGQVLKSDPGPERRLYQYIHNLDVLLILGDIECFKCSKVELTDALRLSKLLGWLIFSNCLLDLNN